MGFFSFFSRATLGIDISPTSIAIVQVVRRRGQLVLQAYASRTIPDNLVSSGIIHQPLVVAGYIKQMLSSHKFTSRYVNVSISDVLVFKQVIQVRADLTEREIDEWISVSAAKCIPYPIDDIYLDYQPLPQLDKTPETNAMVDYLLVAAKKEVVNQRIHALSGMGLNIHSVDMDSLAIERVLKTYVRRVDNSSSKSLRPATCSRDPGILLNAQGNCTEIDYSGTRGQGAGRRDLNCKQILAIDLPDAIYAVFELTLLSVRCYVVLNQRVIFSQEDILSTETLFHTESLLMVEARCAVDPINNRLVNNVYQRDLLMVIQRMLKLFFSSSQYSKLDAILLSGSVVKQFNLVSFIESQLNVPTNLFELFESCVHSDALMNLKVHADCHGLMLAYGLALRGH